MKECFYLTEVKLAKISLINCLLKINLTFPSPSQYELDLPIDVKIGTIGRINLTIPWTGLYTQPVVVHIEDVLVLVGPAISNSYFDPEREKRLMRAAKRKILQDLGKKI